MKFSTSYEPEDTDDEYWPDDTNDPEESWPLCI